MYLEGRSTSASSGSTRFQRSGTGILRISYRQGELTFDRRIRTGPPRQTLLCPVTNRLEPRGDAAQIAALFKVLDSQLPHGDRACIPDASLDRPAEDGHESQHLAGDRAEDEGAPYHGR